LFGDYTFTEDRVAEEVKWSAGAIVEPLDGLRLVGRYFDGKSFNIGSSIRIWSNRINYVNTF
jgi:hypothetical protein